MGVTLYDPRLGRTLTFASKEARERYITAELKLMRRLQRKVIRDGTAKAVDDNEATYNALGWSASRLRDRKPVNEARSTAPKAYAYEAKPRRVNGLFT